MKTDVEALKQKLGHIFEASGEVGLVYLFGSQANGRAASKSDYDFGVYFLETDPVKRGNLVFHFSSEISKSLSTDKIDIHSINDIESPELKYQIIAQGKLIFEREPHRLILEPKTLNEYFDFTYLLKKYNLTRAQ
ncbi:hypothetical protein A2926_01320 [Candidatus Giovannonibacteria bacterium RIFCSPLOWO2_01_FULL_44_40]|uniref:Polymerase beta nucleotidyltransferase domain-containing protein n=1 Tax=Candidatus Giovannonibacteria bacterium RIFCSPHIGHO2_01_FULL_45_23 TaxID=1798325 RepID=A0A1F5VHE3_9BACT|nr:MAG: hypothetical protein A2834_00635 [Candidatus Giovannonibacteria bacterium RIFCSPHIGHO2_01_FULL_45_23]OGF75864.1 MAG: hypothetical protein A3C77_02095 [Candidatus Giovannonibacteria bacterium RIFCSPHIGHO2_02_FULL_45_13]OGF79640.1 MAG: hypothetical protein A2926_01320 [Candidatus Giovannonibacteria bacterium RIFCSPLOWO2_01_FULL_44_40]